MADQNKIRLDLIILTIRNGFQVKREEMGARIWQASGCLAFIGLAYVTNYTRVGLCLIVVHYVSELAEHLALMFDLFSKDENGSKGTK